MNAVGRPVQWRIWRRGTGLSSAVKAFSPTIVPWSEAKTAANILARGADGSVILFTEEDAQGRQYWWIRGVGGELTKFDACAQGDCARLRALGVVADKLVLQANAGNKLAGITIPRGSVIEIPLTGKLTPKDLNFIFEPSNKQSTSLAVLTGRKLVLPILEDVDGRLLLFELDGKGWRESRVDVPAHSSVNLAFHSAAEGGDGIYILTQGFLTAPSLFKLDDEAARLVPVMTAPAGFSAREMSVTQYFAKSADGTSVPYYVVGRMGSGGTKPTIIRGYGYGGTQETPTYDPLLGKLWLENDRLYVLANIRGGGEYPNWNVRGLERRRVYEDFIAVTEDLIRRGLTEPSKLIAAGHSNGGLLVGNIINRRPELFRAAVIQNAVLDLAAWMPWDPIDYGDLDDPQGRANRLVQSPYHSVKAQPRFPAPLITTNSDDRIAPSMSRRYARRLSELGQDYYYFEGADGAHDLALTPKDRGAYYAMMVTYIDQQLSRGPK